MITSELPGASTGRASVPSTNMFITASGASVVAGPLLLTVVPCGAVTRVVGGGVARACRVLASILPFAAPTAAEKEKYHQAAAATAMRSKTLRTTSPIPSRRRPAPRLRGLRGCDGPPAVGAGLRPEPLSMTGLSPVCSIKAPRSA